MSPAEKRGTWRRITMEDTAWRFNKYAERAREAEHVWPDEPATDTPVTAGD
jgi:hypothetical protein